MMEKFRSRRSDFSRVLLALVLLSGACRTARVDVAASGELRQERESAESERAADPSRAVVVFSPRQSRGGGMARVDAWIPQSFAGPSSGVVLEAEAFGRPLRFYRVASPREGVLGFSALVAVPFDVRPGDVKIPVRVRRMDQESLLLDAGLGIVPANYPSETLSVDPRHVSPDARSLKRIQREKVMLGRVYRSGANERLWEGPFEDPVSSIPTSEFGIRRVFNGMMHSYHQGKDYRAVEGTPVLASGAGRVAFAGDLYMTGNTVIIDHGLGLFTIYAHLSVMKVETGKPVPRGYLLGLSGKTGRASGPHLHFGVNLSGVKVDPNDLLRLAR